MNRIAPLAALATLATFALLPIAVHAETRGFSDGKMVSAPIGAVAARITVAK